MSVEDEKSLLQVKLSDIFIEIKLTQSQQEELYGLIKSFLHEDKKEPSKPEVSRGDDNLANWLTVRQAAKYLNVSELTVRKKIKQGLLPTLFPPGETPIRIDRLALDKEIEVTKRVDIIDER